MEEAWERQRSHSCQGGRRGHRGGRPALGWEGYRLLDKTASWRLPGILQEHKAGR